ncbi:MAG: transporter [Acidobacteria bacterium]|nr:transporter [Acidobacteriota bacterium]
MKRAPRCAVYCLLASAPVPVVAIPPLVSGDVPTAPKGICELFVGHILRDDGGVTQHSLPFWELVYGATGRQEFTVEMPVILRDAEGDTTGGVGDAVVGTKVRLIGEPASDSGLSASVEVKLPTGDRDRGLGSGAADLDLRLRWGREVRSNVLYFNLGRTWIGEPEGKRLDDTWFYSAVWDRALQRRIRLLTEVYGKTSDDPDGPDRLAATVGVKWKIPARQQFHFSVGRSLRTDAEGGPRLRVYTGWRWDF